MSVKSYGKYIYHDMLEYDADSSGYDMIEHMLFETGYDAPQNQSKMASAAVVVRVYHGIMVVECASGQAHVYHGTGRSLLASDLSLSCSGPLCAP